MTRRRGGDAGPPCPDCGGANLRLLHAEEPPDDEPMAPVMPAYYVCPVCTAEFARF